jgi:hypothetical protein
MGPIPGISTGATNSPSGDTATGGAPVTPHWKTSMRCKARCKTGFALYDLAPQLDLLAHRASISRIPRPSSVHLAGECRWQSSVRLERPLTHMLTHMHSVANPPPLPSGRESRGETRDTQKEFVQLRRMRKSLGNLLELVRNELDHLELPDGAEHTAQQPGAFYELRPYPFASRAHNHPTRVSTNHLTVTTTNPKPP